MKTTTVAKGVLWLAVGGFGAFSVGFMAKDQPDWISASLYGFALGISALISPTFSAVAAKARNMTIAGAVLVAGCATLADGWGMSRAWQSMTSANEKAAYELALIDYKASIAPDLELIADANAKKLDLTKPADTSVYGSRLEIAAKANAEAKATLDGLIAEAQGRIDAVPAPMAPVAMSAKEQNQAFLIGVLVQAVLALGFFVVNRIERETEPKAANDDVRGYASVRRKTAFEDMFSLPEAA